MKQDLYINELNINWNNINKNSYLHNINSLKKLKNLKFNNYVTIFVGENGSGKSTLIEAIATSYGFNSEGGTLNYNFSTYAESSELSEAITLVKGCKKTKFGYFCRAESFFNLAT